MTTFLVVLALFYVGGGFTLYLMWCLAGLTSFSTPDSTFVRRATAGMTAVGFVHPLGAVFAQDLRRIQAPQTRSAAANEGDSAVSRLRVRLDAPLGVSAVLLAGAAAGVAVVA